MEATCSLRRNARCSVFGPPAAACMRDLPATPACVRARGETRLASPRGTPSLRGNDGRLPAAPPGPGYGARRDASPAADAGRRGGLSELGGAMLDAIPRAVCCSAAVACSVTTRRSRRGSIPRARFKALDGGGQPIGKKEPPRRDPPARGSCAHKLTRQTRARARV